MIRPLILEESQPVKNRNLNRIQKNSAGKIGQVNANSVYCFSTVFTLLQQQQQEVPRNLPCLVLSPVIRFWFIQIYLTGNWPEKLFYFSTLFTTPTAHPVENLCVINRLFRVSTPLSPRIQSQEGKQNLTRLDHHLLQFQSSLMKSLKTTSSSPESWE